MVTVDMRGLCPVRMIAASRTKDTAILAVRAARHIATFHPHAAKHTLLERLHVQSLTLGTRRNITTNAVNNRSLFLTSMSTHDFADSGRLLARVMHAAQNGERVTFLFGSALTAPGGTPGEPGVPDAHAMVEEVIRSFQGTDEFDALHTVLQQSNAQERYQEAMKFILDCRGQDALNQLIRDSVIKARLSPLTPHLSVQEVELDTQGWHLRPAVAALGQLFLENPKTFSEPVLTSNFDPLIEVSIRKAGGIPAAIFLAADGQFSNILAPGTSQVVHLHGYWRGSDTLHTPGQLTRNRPQLKGCLRGLLRETTLVVMAYGGWSDVFTRTLVEVIREQTEALNVLWTFYSDNGEDIIKRNGLLLEQFEPLAGQRVVFYKGVDCHVFLPRLREKLLQQKLAAKTIEVTVVPRDEPTPITISVSEGREHPPTAASWVGREAELRMMLSSSAKVIGITGMGGNGKSTLASKYLEQRQGADEIKFWCWSDCREQSNTLHTQLVRMVERVSGGRIKGAQLQQSDSDSVIEVLLDMLVDTRAILVFDNIDQYVDVIECKAVGSMSKLLELALKRNHKAQFVITGRPRLEYADPKFLHVELSGLSVDEAWRLFNILGVQLDPATAGEKVARVHALTAGHPLALNLIATQVAKNKANLDDLILNLQNGIEAGIENPILPNIWETLNLKQQTVLRYLAELVHPEQEQRIASYLGNALNYNQFSKAIRALKALNLVVVKAPGGGVPDTLELHPLIRDFVRRRFQKEERAPYIDSIIHFCDRMIGKFRGIILTAPIGVLENWTAKVELCLESGRIESALEALLEVHDSLTKSGYAEEFVRLGLEVAKTYQPSPDDKNLAKYDQLWEELVESLSQLGRFDEADALIKQFEASVVGKTSRYVLLCKMRASSYWLRFDFESAKEWARKGVEIKAAGHLDTQHDCTQILALAQRDSKELEPALKYFLEGAQIEAVIDPAKIEEGRGGHFYGNIGRCLQFQEKYRDALVCLCKSAKILEGSQRSNLLMHSGWAAFWIGEVLEADGKFEIAYIAFRRASAKWKTVSPPRVRLANEAADRAREKLSPDIALPADDWECERSFVEWLKKS